MALRKKWREEVRDYVCHHNASTTSHGLLAASILKLRRSRLLFLLLLPLLYPETSGYRPFLSSKKEQFLNDGIYQKLALLLYYVLDYAPRYISIPSCCWLMRSVTSQAKEGTSAKQTTYILSNLLAESANHASSAFSVTSSACAEYSYARTPQRRWPTMCS